MLDDVLLLAPRGRLVSHCIIFLHIFYYRASRQARLPLYHIITYIICSRRAAGSSSSARERRHSATLRDSATPVPLASRPAPARHPDPGPSFCPRPPLPAPRQPGGVPHRPRLGRPRLARRRSRRRGAHRRARSRVEAERGRREAGRGRRAATATPGYGGGGWRCRCRWRRPRAQATAEAAAAPGAAAAPLVEAELARSVGERAAALRVWRACPRLWRDLRPLRCPFRRPDRRACGAALLRVHQHVDDGDDEGTGPLRQRATSGTF